MPMQRYAPSEVRIKTGAGIAEQATAQTWQVLSSELDKWSGMVESQAKFSIEQEAKEQAVIDVQKGEMKETGSFTYYDRAYRDAGHTAYNVKVQIDAKNKADEYATTYKDNPDAFQANYKKFSDKILTEAPDEFSRAITQRAFDKYGVAQHQSLVESRRTKVDEQNKASYESGMALLKEEYVLAVKNNDSEEIKFIEEQMNSLASSGLVNLWTNQNSLLHDRQKLFKTAFTERSLKEFDEAEDKYAFVEKFEQNDKLNDEETQKVVSRFYKSIENDVSNTKRKIEVEDIEHEKDTKTIKRNIYKKLLRGDLSREDINNALMGEFINQSEFDDLLVRMETPSIAKSDSSTYNHYMNNMSTSTVTDILRDENLSRPDKEKLIARKEKLDAETEEDAEEAMDWEGSRNGKEAIGEIMREFKVADNFIMSRTDFDNVLLRDYAYIRKTLFDEVNALPPEQRTIASIQVARRLLKDYNSGEIMGTKPYTDKVDEENRLKKEAEAEAKAKKDKEDEIKGRGNFEKLFYQMWGEG